MKRNKSSLKTRLVIVSFFLVSTFSIIYLKTTLEIATFRLPYDDGETITIACEGVANRPNDFCGRNGVLENPETIFSTTDHENYTMKVIETDGFVSIKLSKTVSVFDRFIDNASNESDSINKLINELAALEYISRTEHAKSQINIDTLLENLGRASIAFNTPKEMILLKEYQVLLIVSNELTKKMLANKLDTLLSRSNHDTIESYVIRASPMLEAQLTGQNFSVTSGSPVRQPVSNMNYTIWEWQVEPKTEGLKHLVLTINAIFNLGGSERPYTIETFRREIDVKVESGVRQILKDNSEWLLAVVALFGTFGAVKYADWLSNKKKEEDINPISVDKGVDPRLEQIRKPNEDR